MENTKFDYCVYIYFYLCEPAVFQIGNWEMKRGQGADLVSIPKCFYMYNFQEFIRLMLSILVWSCSDWFGSRRSQMWGCWCIWMSFEQRIRQRNWCLQCYCTQNLQTTSLLSSTQQCTYSSHVFTNPEFSICNCFFEKKIVFSIRITSIFAFYNLFWFLNANLFRTDQSKLQI